MCFLLGQGIRCLFLARSGPRIALQSCGIYSKKTPNSREGVLRALRKIGVLGLLCNPAESTQKRHLIPWKRYQLEISVHDYVADVFFHRTVIRNSTQSYKLVTNPYVNYVPGVGRIFHPHFIVLSRIIGYFFV